ncbi:MAG: TIGR03936 family radical SAM-associated protein [Pygmaiobacter sp.]
MIRVGFTKQEEACYISHLDLQRVIQRALKKANIPTWYTQGFNPHVYLTFALPLSLGQSSTCETFDFRSEALLNADTIYYSLNEALPRGITVYDVHTAVMEPSEIRYARYLIRFEGASSEILAKLDAFKREEIATVYKKTKKGTQKAINLIEHLIKWNPVTSEEGVLLDTVLPAGGEFSLNPDLIAAYLVQQYQFNAQDIHICRTSVYTGNFENFM